MIPTGQLPQTMIFVRHAIAVEEHEFSGPDPERPLIKKGIKKASKVFRKLLENYQPTRIITSPYVRAQETAVLLQEAIAAAGLPGIPVDTTGALTPDARWEDWAAYLTDKLVIDPRDIVVVIGHEPSLGSFFCRHIGFPEAIPFKKAGIGVIEPETLERARLIAFAPAKFF